MMRFARAFFKALSMTLRGETLTPPHYRPLEAWIREGSHKVTHVVSLADAERIDQQAREALQLKLDGRLTSLEQTLQMARHNLNEEYPRLIRLDDPYSMVVVQSSNMNDQYRVGAFAAADLIRSADLRRALAELDAHLQALPAIDIPQADS